MHDIILDMNNKHYLLALNRIPGIGPRTIIKLLNRWPDLNNLFQLSRDDCIEAGLPPKLSHALQNIPLAAIEADLKWEESESHHTILTLLDPLYPVLLKEIHDPPPVLYAKGALSALNASALAMVGTRKPSVLGRKIARSFAFELAQQELTITSGLALGIDGEVHEGCLAAKGRTIAVMATGIDCIYPLQHAKLAERICVDGLLLTEFPLKVSPNAGHFPRRNRIISGLSLGVLVIEAAIKSGSLITARMAMEQNRSVFAIPGSIYNQQTKGCHYLLQQGAALVTSPQDVLSEIMGWQMSKPIDKPILEADKNESLIRLIGYDLTTVDEVLSVSGLSVAEVICELAEFELQGLIKAVPGGYMRCSQ